MAEQEEKTTTPERSTVLRRMSPQDLPTSPHVDVAMILFLEDIAEKQGVEGLCSYMMAQGAALAETMPPEDYPAWEDFIQAINEGRSIFSALEGMEYFAGYILVTPVSPFHEAIATYTRLMGELLPAHQQVVDYYNGQVQNSAVESMNIIHQAFRKALVQRVSVGGLPVKYAEIASKGYSGEIKLAPEGWLEVLLEKGVITLTQLSMAVRQNSSVILIYPQRPEEAARGAEAEVLRPKVLGAQPEVGVETAEATISETNAVVEQ